MDPDVIERLAKMSKNSDHLRKALREGTITRDGMKKVSRDWKALENRAAEQDAEIEQLREALETLYAVIGLTPILGNKEALQIACDAASKVLYDSHDV